MEPGSRKLKVTIDGSKCVGNAACVATAPGAFELDENMQSRVIDPAAEPADLVLEAAETCPVGAIAVIDAETEESLVS